MDRNYLDFLKNDPKSFRARIISENWRLQKLDLYQPTVTDKSIAVDVGDETYYQVRVGETPRKDPSIPYDELQMGALIDYMKNSGVKDIFGDVAKWGKIYTEVQKGDTVLDLGCGLSDMLAFAVSMEPDRIVKGVDSNEMLVRMQTEYTYLYGAFYCEDIFAHDFVNSYWDHVFLFDVYHELVMERGKDEAEGMLNTIFNHAGTLWFSMPLAGQGGMIRLRNLADVGKYVGAVLGKSPDNYGVYQCPDRNENPSDRILWRISHD